MRPPIVAGPMQRQVSVLTQSAVRAVGRHGASASGLLSEVVELLGQILDLLFQVGDFLPTPRRQLGGRAGFGGRAEQDDGQDGPEE